MQFHGNYPGIFLTLTRAQAESASHTGRCDDDVKTLSEVPGIARQLAKLDPLTLIRELKEYGAWDTEELSDHEQNLQRILWLAACDIREHCPVRR